MGVRYATFAVNGDVPRRDAARTFLTHVGGLAYLPPDTVVAEFAEKITNLENAHDGPNNFHAEGPHAKALLALVPNTGAIPDAVRGSYVKAVVRARVGNGYGISWAAEPYYDRMIARFQEPEVLEFVGLLLDNEVQSRLANPTAAQRFQQIAAQLQPRANNATLQNALEQIINATPNQVGSLGKASAMRQTLGELPI